jgi:hypothetical protein
MRRMSRKQTDPGTDGSAKGLRRAHMPIDINANILQFLSQRGPYSREASYDYCFNYFQGFRNNPQGLANANTELSCLHLGFYLASWGMYRGSSPLLTKLSMKVFVPLIEAIARNEFAGIWDIDVPEYDETNITRLIDCKDRIAVLIKDEANGAALQGWAPSDTLVTKIMLGIFGCVPAFDKNFVGGFGTYAREQHEQGVRSLNPRSLRKIKKFYDDNERYFRRNRRGLNFKGPAQGAVYTKAKLVDMVFWIEGAKGQ